MKKSYQKTDTKRNQKIVKQREAGMSWRDIATFHGISDTRVVKIYKKMTEKDIHSLSTVDPVDNQL